MDAICGSFLPVSDISSRDLGWVAIDDRMELDDSLAREFASASPAGRIGFCFYTRGLSPGEHTIEVYDADGNLIASGPLEIE